MGIKNENKLLSIVNAQVNQEIANRLKVKWHNVNMTLSRNSYKGKTIHRTTYRNEGFEVTRETHLFKNKRTVYARYIYSVVGDYELELKNILNSNYKSIDLETNRVDNKTFTIDVKLHDLLSNSYLLNGLDAIIVIKSGSDEHKMRMSLGMRNKARYIVDEDMDENPYYALYAKTDRYIVNDKITDRMKSIDLNNHESLYKIVILKDRYRATYSLRTLIEPGMNAKDLKVAEKYLDEEAYNLAKKEADKTDYKENRIIELEEAKRNMEAEINSIIKLNEEKIIEKVVKRAGFDSYEDLRAYERTGAYGLDCGWVIYNLDNKSKGYNEIKELNTLKYGDDYGVSNSLSIKGPFSMVQSTTIKKIQSNTIIDILEDETDFKMYSTTMLD